MTLLSPRRTGSDTGRDSDREVALEATVPIDVGRKPSPFAGLSAPRSGWLALAVIGSVAAAGFGWVLVSGLAVVGWLAAAPGSFGGALRVGTELWLLTNGAGASLDGNPLTLTPTGVTLLWVLMLGRFARVAARHRRGRPVVTTGLVTAVMTGVYGLALLLVTGLQLLTGTDPDPIRLVRALVGAVVIAAPVVAWQAADVAGFDPTSRWPVWARAVPRAVTVALVVLAATGAAVLTAGVLVHLNRVGTLWQSLDAGVVGGIVLLLLQLAYLPTFVVWGTSYALGAGVSLGTGSVVATRATDLGLLPSVPILGALPAEGPGSAWQLAWLAGGVLAGAAAALVVVRARRRARADETALVGGLAGAVAGLVAVGVAALTSGGWGGGRLAHLGPQLPVLLVLAPVTLGLAGMVAGLLAGLAPVPGRVVARLRSRADR